VEAVAGAGYVEAVAGVGCVEVVAGVGCVEVVVGSKPGSRRGNLRHAELAVLTMWAANAARVILIPAGLSR
jgi:hypothetical protein